MLSLVAVVGGLMLSCILAALVVGASPTTLEASAGAAFSIASVTGSGGAVGGVGLGGALSFGGDVYLSLNGEFTATPRLAEQAAEAAFGAGWRFYDDGDLRIAAGAGLGAALVPYRCSDCFGVSIGVGLSPNVDVTWRLNDWFGVVSRAQLFVHTPLNGDKPWAAFFLSFQPLLFLSL
jgi:hypothetical protein